MEIQGLSTDEAKKRLKSQGFNEISRKKRISDWQLVLAQIKSPLIYVLLVAMGITGGILHDIEDTIVIGLAVVLNTALGFFQERKANRSLEALALFLSPKTKARRDGKWQMIEAKEIVAGDVVRLEIGGRIPADGEVIKHESLAVDEAILTGESESVDKKVKSQVFMGTTVAVGIGEMVVRKTGHETKFGEIAESLEETEKEVTPLQKQIEKFARGMALAVFVIVLLVMAIGLGVGDPFREIFPTAVALAVAAIPEGLAVSLTVILAIGMQRILKKKALIRKLLAAETLGGVTVICTDKTGTLTEGKMKVVNSLVCDKEGEKEQKEKLKLLERSAVLCNDMRDPLEAGMMDWAKKQMKGSVDELQKKYPRMNEIPFSPKWRYIATLHEQKNKNLMLVSGAPEEVIKRCKGLKMPEEKWLKRFEAEARKGRRLVGFAYKNVEVKKLEHGQIKDLVWLGSLVYEDPIRKGVEDVLRQIQEAGVEVKVVTGDYRFTAEAVINNLGMVKGQLRHNQVMEGSEMKNLSKEELKKKIKTIKLFARTGPEQKLRIVEALQEEDEVVVMTGDGVNDAPALKKADIGIVVNEASDVSKETADMVLLDSNFSTIVGAIEGGRMIQDNLKKVILYLLADSFGEILLVLISLVVGVPLPVTAGMILWINLVSDGFPGLALTVEPAEEGLLKRKPSRHKYLINQEVGLIIALISIVSAATAFGAFWYYWHTPGYGLEHARSVAFSLLGLNSLFYVWSARSMSKPIWRENFFKNPWLIMGVVAGLGLQLFGLYSSLGQRLLGTVGIDWSEWVVVVVGSVIMMMIVEGVKWAYNRKV